MGLLKKLFGTAQERQLKRYRKVVTEINRLEEGLQSLTDDQVRAKTDEFKQRLKDGEELDALLPEAYAVVKNVCRRLFGTDVDVSGYHQKWDMIPYDVQILSAIGMHHGAISEMMTGEGKTLTSTLPLYLNALTGDPVHLVTVNDYLCKRDCEWVGTIFRWLGLTTGVLTGDTPAHARKEVYEADIVYGTASEFGFDYLRDNSMAARKEQQVQRGHYFALVDEIDSILIDEARTPLIISGPVPVSRQMYDKLKGSVSDLVRKQRDLCNRYATEARKTLDSLGMLAEEANVTLTKEQDKEAKEAFKKLWRVSKGTPNNRILKRIKENPDLRVQLDQLDLFYHADNNKAEKTKVLSELFVVIDEKGSEYELTDKGIRAWQERSGAESAEDFVMLDLGHEYAKIDSAQELARDEKLEKKVAIREEDAHRKERAHNLRQLLRGHLLMERDVDYMVHEGKVVIIDENTGRAQPGRRFSDGLHQAIEAKEEVSIQKESQTYATITLQNYFRMYDKLAGMTGTAMTEAHEFKEIYEIDVLEIPTNRPCVRKDSNDEVYMTEREKYNALLKEVRDVHGQGRPILVGTESVEVSEKLSRILKSNQLPHTVLNAKHNDREAEIVAAAGQKGAITIATNMAGRGTDIKLGQGVAELGGLHVIGASRHQSRRIDRQLRGRCARQGDPGTSKFFVSFEDQLMRLFASPRLNGLLKKLRPPEGEPISAGILNRSIETAQKRIEQRNYTVRKHTVEYDDVMNKQRQEIYSFRNEILRAESIEPIAEALLVDVCGVTAEEYFVNPTIEGGWDPEGYRQWLMHHFPVAVEEGAFDNEQLDLLAIEGMAAKAVVEAFKQKMGVEAQKVEGQDLTIVHEAVRNLMVHSIDKLWQEHLLMMDHLRSDVGMQAVGQKDPLMEFKHEAFRLFNELSHTLRTKIATDLFRFELVRQQQGFLQEALGKLQLETQRSLAPQEGGDNSPVRKALEAQKKSQPKQEEAPRIGRNDACPCGSGKKYKRCCGATADV